MEFHNAPAFPDQETEPTEPLIAPFRNRPAGASRGRFGAFGATGLNGLIGAGIDSFGFSQHLEEIGVFNPLIVTPFVQALMKRSVMPRLALIILGASLSERQYVMEGADPKIEAFHQAWLDKLLPQVLRKAANAVWFGWQPFVIDWKMTPDGMWIPAKAHDVDNFTTDVLEHPITHEFAGLTTEGGNFDRRRALKLTWQGDLNNHFGVPQALTCQPYWWAWSVVLVWTMRYYERSVDPVRLAFARNISVPTGRLNDDGTQEHVDLTQLVADAMDIAANGDSVGVPLPDSKDDGPLVDIKTLEHPDRADTWLKILDYLERKQFTSTLALPAIGLSSGQVTFENAREAQKTQNRVLEAISDELIMSEFNDDDGLIAQVHRINGLPGEPPTLKGKAFKREQQETLLDILKPQLNEIVPEVDGEGELTGREYRVGDLIRYDLLLKGLDIAGFEVSEISRELEEITAPAPGIGGRPSETFGQRADDRANGQDR